MLDNNAQAIFMLTYRITEKGQYPLNSQEYSSLALAIRKANLEGPGALLSMSETDLSDGLGLPEELAFRIKKLLTQAGTASLYLDRFFNQGFGLITRTDDGYPVSLKKSMQQNAPPFLTFAGDERVLNSISSPLVVTVKDIKDMRKLQSLEEKQDLIVIIESTGTLKLLKFLDNYEGKVLIVSSIGLSNIVRFPVVRDLLHRAQVQIISTAHLEAKENSSPYNDLRSIAEALSGDASHTPESDVNGSETEQFIDFECTVKNKDEKVKELDKEYHSADLPVDSASVNIVPGATETPQRMSSRRENKVVYTIGHSNHDIEKFIGLLKTFSIEILADLRSSPNSKYVPQFNQGNLKKYLDKVGIQYLFLGNTLGGRPEDKTVLNSQGQIVREFIEERDWYRESILNLEKLIKSGEKIALMCAEENPADCHRGYIVSNTLVDDEFIVKHIRQNGEDQIRGSLASPSDQIEIVFE